MIHVTVVRSAQKNGQHLAHMGNICGVSTNTSDNTWLPDFSFVTLVEALDQEWHELGGSSRTAWLAELREGLWQAAIELSGI